VIDEPNESEPAASGDDEIDVDEIEDDGVSDRLVLRASAMRWVWVIIASMVFVALGAAMALGESTSGVAQLIGWLLVVAFGFCAFVAVRQMVNPGSLVVSRTTIDMLHRGRLASFDFSDCGPFTTWRNPSRGQVYVVFDHRPDGDSELNRTNRRLMGGSRLLSDNYGMSAETLADLLEGVRTQPATAGE